jgi:hypothetical protein
VLGPSGSFIGAPQCSQTCGASRWKTLLQAATEHSEQISLILIVFIIDRWHTML